MITALGAVRVERSHAYCRGCGQPGFAADALLGIDGRMTAQAGRMACLAGVHDPFRKAERLLAELAGWSADAETLRRHCHAEAARARSGRAGRGGSPGEFADAAGEGAADAECHIDAGKVNTPEGWRDVKLAAFARRRRGGPSDSAGYEQRDLPGPAARSVVAEVEEAADFGRRCAAEARRLGVAAGAGLSVLGDGAEWIWNLAERHFAGAAQVLDVYHALEHLAAAGRAAFAGAEGFDGWFEGAKRGLIGDGYIGACGALSRLPVGQGGGGEVAAALNYLCGHRGRLGYAARLARGQAIGSGLVEGTIKQRVNVRMKRSGARWLAGHVGPLVELMAMADTPEWSEHWAMTAA